MTRALLAVLLTAAGMSGGTTDHGPIAIYQPALTCPIEAAGTGLRPLVRVKLAVDAAGRVARVEVTGVEPSSALDEVFRTAARDGLTSWRFAPAEQGGAAIDSEVALAVQFFAPSEGPPQPGRLRRPASVAEASVDAEYESLRYELRAKILALTAVARKQAADEIAASAETFLHPGKRSVARDDWFEVVTDSGGQKQADAILNNLHATFAAVYKALGTRIPPRPREERLRAYVFETRAQYDAFSAGNLPFEGSAGFYAPAGVLAFHTQQPTVGFLLEALLHEATHAFVDRHVTMQGVLLPRWLDEGFAEYVGASDITAGQIVLGAHKNRKEFTAYGMATLSWQSPSRARSEVAQSAQRAKRALTLKEIVDAGPETFYGKDVDLMYAQGWLAVHFLRHGRPSWSETEFPRFLLYAAEGYPATDALRAVYGVRPDDLEGEYQRYVKSF